MKHGNKNRKFGLTSKKRKALLSSLASSLIVNGKIKTTEAKAKEIRPMVEKMVTRAGQKSVAAARILGSAVNDLAMKKLLNEIGPRFVDQKGGYLRIIRMPVRVSDGARMAQIEFVN